MDIPELKVLINHLREEIIEVNTYSTGEIMNEAVLNKYRNLIVLCGGHLEEHETFLNHSYGIRNKKDIFSSLSYLELLFDLVEKQNSKSKKNGSSFLYEAREKWEQACVAFNRGDYPGVSNNLNTCIELALKDVLDIPTTIKGIKTSNLIDIMIADSVGPVAYLKEVKTHVLMDNLVKHQGLSPVEYRSGMAIKATDNLLKKLPSNPIALSQATSEKIWKGIK